MSRNTWKSVVKSPAKDADVMDEETRKLARKPGAWKSDYWLRVEKSPSCWAWHGAQDVHGHGVMLVGGMWVRADRLGLQLAGVKVPHKAKVVHRCQQALCMNPAHLSVEFRVHPKG